MYEVKNAKNTFVWTSDLQDGYKSQRLDQLIKNYFHQIKIVKSGLVIETFLVKKFLVSWRILGS